MFARLLGKVREAEDFLTAESGTGHFITRLLSSSFAATTVPQAGQE
nr:hypothetical protein [Halobellus limi]